MFDDQHEDIAGKLEDIAAGRFVTDAVVRSLAAKAAARIRELEAERKWRPIETAPKDGRDVLCYVPGLGMGRMVLYWLDGYWREKANGLGLTSEPVCWMQCPEIPSALPTPPSPTKEEK